MLFQKIMWRGDSGPPEAPNGSQRAPCCWLFFITTWFLFKGFELSPNNWPCEGGLHLRAHNWPDAQDIYVRLLENQQVNLGNKSSVGPRELGDIRDQPALKPDVSMSIRSSVNKTQSELSQCLIQGNAQIGSRAYLGAVGPLNLVAVIKISLYSMCLA